MTIHDLSEKLGNYLSNKIREPGKAPVLTYGLELIIGELSKLSILLLTAYICGLLIPMLLLLFTYIPLRLLTGGQHCSSNFRCLITTLVIFIPLSFLAWFLSFKIGHIQLLLLAFTAFWFLVTKLNKYGPGVSINYPNLSSTTINKIKQYVEVFLIAWIFTILILNYFMINNGLLAVIITSTSIGVYWQGFLITPLGHRFIKRVDSGLILIKIR